MELSELHVVLDWSWLWVVPLLGAILLIAVCIGCYQCLQGIRGVGYMSLPRTALCQVECYGQGEIHNNIVKKLNITEEPGAPLVLFVYKVSRETEDLHNALQWIEGKQGRNRDNICAVILLEKSADKQKRPMEFAQAGTFDANTVVVRILWQERQCLPNKILDCPSNKEAMEKVKQNIIRCQ